MKYKKYQNTKTPKKHISRKARKEKKRKEEIRMNSLKSN